MPARERLSPTEQTIGYVIGLGIAAAISAAMFRSFGTLSVNVTTSMLLVGIALAIIGTGAWMILVHPWDHFDDLKTPYYTGHETHEAHTEEEEEPLAAHPVKPGIAEPELVVPPDELTLIEGIGPKTADALIEVGITSFEQIAEMSPEELETTVRAQGVRIVSRTDTWPIQARMAADGDLTALDDYQARTKGGVLHDELTVIDGIGPKTEAALYEAGVRTYAELAALSADDLHDMLDQAGLRSVNPEGWPEAAAAIVKRGKA